MIDLRSDTVTRPTPAMRQAMMDAEVGDDVYGEDPTVNRLQDKIAMLLGKEAALFVPSGTMANQIAVHVLTEPGSEVILDASSHLYNYETGAAGMLSGVQLHPVTTDEGLLTSDAVTAAVRPTGAVFAPSRLVAIEQTANKAGGRIYPVEQLHAVAKTAHEHGLNTLLDGARLWNASAATGISEAEYAAPFDMVWVALSKGLGAPVGAVLAGSESTIAQARRTRKRLGGGMRQSGILAAAGLHALAHHRSQLASDHDHARQIAEAATQCAGFHVDMDRVETNIIMVHTDTHTAESVSETLAAHNVMVTPFGPHTVRITTHRDISEVDVEQVCTVLHAVYS